MAQQRISDATRAAVVEAMRSRVAGKPTVREIADRHGISTRSVTNVCNAAGHTSDVSREQTKNATAELQLTNAQRRAHLAARLLDAAGAALDEIDNGSVITGIAFGEVVSKRIAHLTARDRQALMTAAAIGIDKHRALDLHDAATDNTDVAKWLAWMQGMPGAGQP